MKGRTYVLGIPHDVRVGRKSACFEAELDDHRTVQMVVYDDGTVLVRGWGNAPQLVGNMTQVSFEARVSPQDPTTDEHCNPLPAAATHDAQTPGPEED